jgi:tetratricopeptide (TPR) repeat protein
MDKKGSDFQEKAWGLIQSSDWENLLKHSIKWTRKCPDDYLAFSALGLAYDKLERYEQSLESYASSLQIYDKEPDVWFNYGLACLKLKFYDDAIGALETALYYDPEYVKAMMHLAIAYESKGDFNEALEIYKNALEIRPNDIDILHNIFWNLMKSNKPRHALKVFNIMESIDPESVEKLGRIEYLKEQKHGWKNSEVMKDIILSKIEDNESLN